jgi:hypothetical protein
LAGEGQVSEIVAETPQIPIPAGIASFSQHVIHAVKEAVEMRCIVVGHPKSVISWTKKYTSIRITSSHHAEGLVDTKVLAKFFGF